jgi:hypothetical protein
MIPDTLNYPFKKFLPASGQLILADQQKGQSS